jgi:hypothetical protein
MVHSLHSWRFADRSLAVDTYPLLGECYHTSFNTANREQKWVVKSDCLLPFVVTTSA